MKQQAATEGPACVEMAAAETVEQSSRNGDGRAVRFAAGATDCPEIPLRAVAGGIAVAIANARRSILGVYSATSSRALAERRWPDSRVLDALADGHFRLEEAAMGEPIGA